MPNATECNPNSLPLTSDQSHWNICNGSRAMSGRRGVLAWERIRENSVLLLLFSIVVYDI